MYRPGYHPESFPRNLSHTLNFIRLQHVYDEWNHQVLLPLVLPHVFPPFFKLDQWYAVCSPPQRLAAQTMSLMFLCDSGSASSPPERGRSRLGCFFRPSAHRIACGSKFGRVVKALALGASLERGVGSNPTVTFFPSGGKKK